MKNELKQRLEKEGIPERKILPEVYGHYRKLVDSSFPHLDDDARHVEAVVMCHTHPDSRETKKQETSEAIPFSDQRIIKWLRIIAVLLGILVLLVCVDQARAAGGTSQIDVIRATDGVTTVVAAAPFTMTFSGCTVGGTGSAWTINCAGGPGGSGTVTSVGDLSPLFTTATRTTTPAFSLTAAAAHAILGNNTAGSSAPTYFVPACASLSDAGAFCSGTAYSSLTGTPQLAVTLANASHKWLNSYSSVTGLFTQTQPDYSDLTGTPQLAVTIANASHKWLNSYTSSTGVFTQTQPDYADLTGTPALPANTTATASNFFTAYNSTTGAFTKAQPAFTDISGVESCAQEPAQTGDVTTSGCAATLAASIAGSHTFTGTFTLANLNKTVYADQQAGADACAKINAAFALLPTTTTGAGGIVDATGFAGDQSCSAGITFAPANSSVLLKLGDARFIVGGSGAALTCPATIACSIYGIPTNTGTTGWGSTIIHNGAGNDGIDWFGSYGTVENLHVDSSNITCASTCASLLIKGITGTSASHNVFINLRLTGPGTSITNSAGIALSADTSSALACCNTFEGLSVSAYADGIRMVTTNNQGPTDNSFYGFYDFANVTGINIVQGDVNYFLGGIISSNTTGITVTTGTGNNFHTRLESNTTGCTSSGVGGFFIISEDAATCSVAAGANGDNFLGTGNTGILPSQRLQSSLILPTGTALEFDGDTGISRTAGGTVAIGNSSAGDASGQLGAANVAIVGVAPATSSGATGTNATTSLSVTAAVGGADSNATGTAGTGGSPVITAGAGGAGTGTNTVGGAGGGVTLTAGNGGASLGTGANANGGGVSVALGQPGTGGSGTAGKTGVLQTTDTGGHAGFHFYTQGTANTTANANVPANSIIEEAPTAVTAYKTIRPGTASNGVQFDVNASGVITQNRSGSFGAVSQTAKTAAVTTFTVCAATANTACGQAGQYRLTYNVWGSGTACATVTAGSMVLNFTWTDENAVTHTTINAPMWDQKTAAMTSGQVNFNTALGTEGGSGSFIVSTNGTIIQAATTYTACTSGTGTYNVRITTEQLQ